MIEPVRIESEAIYDDGSLCQTLGLTPTTLAAARRDGSLRYARIGKRVFYKGAWLLSWLDAVASSTTTLENLEELFARFDALQKGKPGEQPER